MTQNNAQIASATSALEGPAASSSTFTWVTWSLFGASMTTTSLMSPFKNRAINEVASAEDSKEDKPGSGLQTHPCDFPLRPVDGLIVQPAHDVPSAEVEPAPMQANSHEASSVDIHCASETHNGVSANAVIPIRDKGRKQWELLTAEEWTEQYQVLCIDMFNYFRRHSAEQEEPIRKIAA